MRARGLALAGLLVGAGLALVAGAQPWWRAVGDGVSVAFSGTDASGGLTSALAVVVLAGTLLALVLRARGRQVLGVLLALAGAGLVALGLVAPRPSAGAVRSQVREVSLADQFGLEGTAWGLVHAGAGLVVLAAAVLMLLTAPRWPTRTARFERSATGPAPTPGTEDPAVLWHALDDGVDPTLEVDEAGRTAGAAQKVTGESVRPGVRETNGGDTMGDDPASRPAPGPV